MTPTRLFERLASPGPGTTVVTPNQRLSQALVRELDAFQLARGRAVWDAPDILPFGAFVQRLYEDALYRAGAEALPALLSASQEEQLWRQVIAPSGLLALAETAARCREAWSLAHAWRIPPHAGNEDATAFAAWAAAYEKKTAGEVDLARLPDLAMKQLGRLELPKTVAAYAFDILPPQTRELFDALAARGVQVVAVQPEGKNADVSRAAFGSAKEELEDAAQWARARLQAGAKRIGVVIPDLQERRREVVRVFSRVMQPGFNLPGAARAPMPFNVSLGSPLADYPLVAAALRLLEVSQGEIAFEAASRLVRSPFLGGAEREAAARARLEVRLRRKVESSVSLPRLVAHAERAPVLRGLLEKLYGFREDGLFAAKTPSEWARHFSALLAGAGFPGERSLDSAEFQAQAKWHEALGEFARLDRVCGAMAFPPAFGILKRICGETLFQPESPPAPVQVLGVLESAGIEFDHLRVCGLTDEAWPLKPRANAFLPLAAQRKAGVPEAAAETSLALDRRLTEGWKRAAGEVVLSYFTRQDDREVAPSALILELPEKRTAVAREPGLRDRLFALRNVTTTEDRVAPPVRARQLTGGTRVLADQAACPFRAFARHRLAADTLDEPPEGLDAARRGKLLHELMKHLWESLKDSSALEQDVSGAIEQAAAAAVKALAIEGRFAELERARLARIAREWLELEKTRAPFSVISVERKINLAFGGLEFTGYIDRMDRLSTGGHALLDYKTSRNPSPKHWEPPRPDDPQLALYAVSVPEEVTAVAFARVRPGEMRFMGFSRDDRALPKVQTAKAWQPLLRKWKDEAQALAGDFAGGEARVDPKRDLLSCRYCGLETLCRVYEKINVLAEEESEE